MLGLIFHHQKNIQFIAGQLIFIKLHYMFCPNPLALVHYHKKKINIIDHNCSQWIKYEKT